MRKRKPLITVYAIAFVVIFSFSQVEAFSALPQRLNRKTIRRDSRTWLSVENENEGPEKSQMNDFVADYLRKSKSDAGDREEGGVVQEQTYSHLIALPVDACHEVMLELESVQRAILYHCPVLVHSCITAATTRLPLFYVHAPRNHRPHSITARIKPIVTRIVNDVVDVEDDEDDNSEESDEDDTQIKIKRDDGEPDITGANESNVKPLIVKFLGLEIDGAENNCLTTVAVPASAKRLVRFASALAEAIEAETGWKTEFPEDPNKNVSDSSEFRARIPFMRLPENWHDFLDPKEGEEVWMLPSEEGGNGISPIFWGKWMEDTFGQARMREVGIYQNQADLDDIDFRLDEKTFYMPVDSVMLPGGNLALRKQEAELEAYSDKRMEQAEALKRDENMQATTDGDDLLLSKTKSRLEELYEETPSEMIPQIEIVDNGSLEKREEKEEEFVMEPPKPGDPEDLDYWMKDRIKNIVEGRGKVQSELKLSKRKDKPPIAENPIFEKFKNGTLVPASNNMVKPATKLPDFPSREHCVGFWRVINSPTGFDVEEGNDARSDNFVLRVDGTVSGGPILDQETRQKASGGTWRFVCETSADAGILIRLVIPPSKERILVMEGNLERVSMSNDLPLASSTFGIPELEARKAAAQEKMEDIISCTGKVWIEDAITRKNKDEIGKFSLQKLQTPSDRSEYTITIPKPVRNQD